MPPTCKTEGGGGGGLTWLAGECLTTPNELEKRRPTLTTHSQAVFVTWGCGGGGLGYVMQGKGVRGLEGFQVGYLFLQTIQGEHAFVGRMTNYSFTRGCCGRRGGGESRERPRDKFCFSQILCINNRGFNLSVASNRDITA